MKLDKEEKEILNEVERGEWKSTVKTKKEMEPYRLMAKETLANKKNVNVKLSEHDIRSLRKMAAKEGIPWQSLATSILHRYVNKRVEV